MDTNYPQLDLHGLDRIVAKLMLEDFINDNIIMKNKRIIVIHGVGEGILKKMTHDTLKKDKRVKKYYQSFFNLGITIIEL